MIPTLKQAALAYARHGWPVFPLKPRAKEPLTPHGFKDATSDLAAIEQWWTETPDANIGFVPGAAQLVVLDVDGPEGRAAATPLGLLSEPTLAVLTGRPEGGLHLYYRHPGFHVGNVALAEHLDVRGDDGYVLLPPSVHPFGARYRWDKAETLSLPSDALAALGRINGNGPRRTRAARAVPETPPVILEGQRNSVLTSLAGTMRRRGMSAEEILAGISAVNTARCDPPLSDDELEQIAASIGRYTPTRPLEADEEGRPRVPLLRSLAELLADPDALNPPAAVVPRLAWRGFVTLLVGREKLGGKSTLLTAGAAAVTRGEPFLGEPCVQGRVLWASADQEHARLITQRAARFGADPARFHVLWPREPFADLLAALDQLDPGLALIVIDTLANFARVEDPHSSAEWPAVLLPLRGVAHDRDLAVILAHHALKAEGGGYRDSTAIGANVDMLLTITRATDTEARRKVEALGRWPASNFAVELVGDRYELVAGGELSLDAQILAYVHQHPRASNAAVRVHVGGRGEDVDAAIGRLIRSEAVRDAGTEHRHAYEATATAETTGEASDAPPF